MSNSNHEILFNFLSHLKRRNYSPNSITLYNFVVTSFIDQIDPLPLTQVKYIHVQKYFQDLKNINKAVTVNTHRSILSVLYKFMKIKLGYAGSNPIDKLSKQKVTVDTDKNRIEAFEIERLYYLMEEDNTVKARDVTMFDLFYGTGIRATELTNLKFKDLTIDCDTGILRIRQGKGNKDRDVILPDYTLNSLRKHIQRRKLDSTTSDHIFVNDSGTKFTRQHIYNIFDHILGKLFQEKKGPHRLRHAFATHFLEQTRNLKATQKQLGHASPSTTQRYINQKAEEVLKEFIKTHPKERSK